MSTLNRKPFVAMLFLAASVSAFGARAQGLPVHDVCCLPQLDDPASNADMQAHNGRFAERDLSGWTLDGNAQELQMGPQYRLDDHSTLGGEWERKQDLDGDGHPGIDPYRFGLRIGF
jgi:hypothetical protein